MKFKGYRVIASISASAPIYEFTGRITKTLVYALNPNLSLTRGVKGVLSPLHISPLFYVQGDHELGEPAYPVVDKKKNGEQEIKPVELNGEYIFHIGGGDWITDKVVLSLAELTGPFFVKFGNAIISCKVEKVVDVTRETIEKAESVSGKIRVYLKSPSQIFNIFTPTRLPKFSPTAVELLMTPYALSINTYTITSNTVMSASRVLGALVETWYSLRTLKPVEIIFKGRKQVNLAGHTTYIIDNADEKIRPKIQETLALAELAGIGRSRINGFGTTVIH